MTTERVRGVIFDGDRIVLFQRDRPNWPRYWTLPGGGVEADDADLVAALYRELDEELRAVVTEPVYLAGVETDNIEGRRETQHLFACHLVSMDFANRFGPEFSNPAKGIYEVVYFPPTAAALSGLLIHPVAVGAYLIDNIEEITARATAPR
ncbi:NUDIX domain-containing protein [Hamadaea tsunoensis]|uniref:NUDIX domain-containing protein n=1 Tax=Hamadaea tsunoensis TaxID=53368 RepID=UPI00040A4C69|nr:NUDIX hydrolase [Hamadaea tsunoensis]